jgi:hypothetical protein
MTITSNDTRDEYTATAGQTVFNYTFKIFSSTDLSVYVTPSGQDANDTTDIVTPSLVTGVGDESGGTVTIAATSNGDKVTIVSNITEERTTDYQNNGDFRPDTVNEDFDRVVSISKQTSDFASRGLTFQKAEQGVSGLTLTPPVANNLIQWNETATGTVNYPLTVTGTTDHVSSIAALRLVDTDDYANGDNVIVNGYYTSGDGGGGLFYWDSTSVEADNNGTIIQVTGVVNGRFKRHINDSILVDWFGAKGDGTTDDESAINAAITAYPGYRIEFDASKSYYITDSITLGSDRTHLYASAVNPTLITSDQNIYMLVIQDCLYAKTSNLGIYNTNGTPTQANVLMGGKAKVGQHNFLLLNGNRYGVYFEVSAGPDPGGIFYNEFNHLQIIDPTRQCVYFSDTVGANENYFWGGYWSNTNYNQIVRLTGNNNKIVGTAFENAVAASNYTDFTVHDLGYNIISKCRFETDGHGILVENDSGNYATGTLIEQNYWACSTVRVACKQGRAFTDSYGDRMTFSGFVIGAANGNTSVDVESASGQKVVSISSTSNFKLNMPVVINPGNSTEEWHIIDSIQDGVSITLLSDLVYTHAVGQTVQGWGSLYGQYGRPSDNSSYLRYYAAGRVAFEIDGDPGAGSERTSLVLYDKDSDDMYRVFIGAADSGGSGYRLLRILN